MLLSLVFKTRVCHANMAASLQRFETTDSILSPTAVAPILERHVTQLIFTYVPPTGPFTNSWYTWEASEHVILLVEGFREGHGHVSVSHERVSWGFPAYSLAVYYADPHVRETWHSVPLD